MLPPGLLTIVAGIKACGLGRHVTAVLLFLCVTPSFAFGKDLNVLIRVLYAAFLVEQTSSLCLTWVSSLSNEDRAIFTNTRAYRELIKPKVESGLNAADVDLVLKSAADRAKAEVLEAVTILRSYGPEREPVEFDRWCANSVKPHAKQVVGTYVRQPEVIDALIQKAKLE